VAGRAHRLKYSTNFGLWAGLPIVVFAFMANLLKLIINLTYLYANPDAQIVGIDPVTGFVFGLGMIWVVGYLLKGLQSRSVWAAVGLTAAMPLLYVLMVDGVVAAQLHIQMYFLDNWRQSLVFEVVPACVLVLLFGAQALMNYHQRFRRVH
jgi:hypothetical protein